MAEASTRPAQSSLAAARSSWVTTRSIRSGLMCSSSRSSAAAAPAVRASSAACGVTLVHTSGSARSTMLGAKLKKAATTGGASTAPNGAARPAK